MTSFKIFGCHVTVIGIIFDCLNFVLFLMFLVGTSVVQTNEEYGMCDDVSLLDPKNVTKCNLTLGLLIFAILLFLAEIVSTGFLLTAVLYSKGRLVIVPLVVSYVNIVDALVFSILSIMDASNDRKMGDYIMTGLLGGKDPGKDAILAASVTLSCLLVIALAFCVLNTFVHTRIWQYYKKKREEEDWMSETTSQISIIATFKMDMVYDEWKKKEDRTITSIAEEDEEEESKEETVDLW